MLFLIVFGVFYYLLLCADFNNLMLKCLYSFLACGQWSLCSISLVIISWLYIDFLKRLELISYPVYVHVESHSASQLTNLFKPSLPNFADPKRPGQKEGLRTFAYFSEHTLSPTHESSLLDSQEYVRAYQSPYEWHISQFLFLSFLSVYCLLQLLSKS